MPLVGVSGELGELLAQQTARYALEAVDEHRERKLRGVVHEQMDVVRFSVALLQASLASRADDREDVGQALEMGLLQDRAPIFGNKDQVCVQLENTTAATSELTCIVHGPMVLYPPMPVETYQFALKTAPRHERCLSQWAGCRRFVYNELLVQEILPIAKQRQEEREQTGKATTPYPSVYDLQKRLPKLKEQYPFLKGPPSHALQQAAVDLNAALLRVHNGAGFPTLRRKGRSTDSFRENDPRLFTVDQQGSRIRIPKLGWVRYHNSRRFEGIPKTLTIVRKAGRWFASIQVQTAQTPPLAHEHAQSVVGIDRGIALFAAVSDGSTIGSVSPLKSSLRELRTAQRAVARKQKGSKNRRRAQQSVRRIHHKVANIRRDVLHKASTTIAKNHGVVVLEKLDVSAMSRSAEGSVEEPGKNVAQKRALNRGILDAGWSMFEQMLSYKLAKRGGQLLFVSSAYTSQRCSMCGHTAADNRTSQASFRCVSCGHTENADINAAKNILRAGQALLGAVVGKPMAEHQPSKRRAQNPARSQP